MRAFRNQRCHEPRFGTLLAEQSQGTPLVARMQAAGKTSSVPCLPRTHLNGCSLLCGRSIRLARSYHGAYAAGWRSPGECTHEPWTLRAAVAPRPNGLNENYSLIVFHRAALLRPPTGSQQRQQRSALAAFGIPRGRASRLPSRSRLIPSWQPRPSDVAGTDW